MPVNLVFISYLPGQTLVRYAHSRFARVNMKIHTKFTGIEKGKVIIIKERFHFLPKRFLSDSSLVKPTILVNCATVVLAPPIAKNMKLFTRTVGSSGKKIYQHLF